MFNSSESNPNQQEANQNYFEQFCKAKQANQAFRNELRQLVEQRKDLKLHFQKLEKKNEQIFSVRGDSKKKRIRRVASQIQRKYLCPAEYCQKAYGVQGALNQHIKLKHPQLFQKYVLGAEKNKEKMKQQVQQQ